MSKHPFRYDPTFPIRDPRTRLDRSTDDDLILDMAAIIALKVAASFDGTVYEAELLDAGFTPAEIERVGPRARAGATERLAPRQVEHAPGQRAA